MGMVDHRDRAPATHGTAATLDEAKAKFRANWTKAKAGD
jgi:hypothetical protein